MRPVTFLRGSFFPVWCAALLGLAVAWSGQAQAATVVNGDFESGADAFVSWPGYVGFGNNPAEIPGWTGTGNRGINPVVPGGPTDAPFRDNGDNNTHVAFMQQNATLSQVVSGLTVGADYVLSFDFNARNCCGDLPVASLSLNGVVVAQSSDIFPPPGGIPPVGDANPWYHADIPFTATSPTLEILFSTSTVTPGGDATFLLDNVTLVPEPSTLLLSLLGLGAVGLWLRQSRSR